MEKDGWLDQALFAVLGVLNAKWLAVLVGVGGSFAVAFAAKRSTKETLRAIQDGFGRVLLGAFFALAVVKSSPRLVLPQNTFTCDREPGILGTTVSTNCRTVTTGEFKTVYDYTLLDELKDMYTSLAYDVAFSAVGLCAGLTAAWLLSKPGRTI